MPGGNRPSGASERSASGWARALVPWLALVLLAAAPYARTLGHPLLYDDRTLLDNRWLRDSATPGEVFARDYWHGTRHEGSDLYRPVTVLSLMANLRMAPSRIGFRLANVALHAGAVLMVALALREILGAGRGRPEPGRGDARGGLPLAAWIGASLFAVHPLASEAVLLAVGRAEILAAAFGLAAFVTCARSEEASGRFGWRLAASGLLFFLALGSKESAVAWVVLVPSWLRIRALSGRGAGKSRLGWVLAPAAALGAFAALRISALGARLSSPPVVDNPLASADFATRFANAVLLQGRYAAKMLFPARLTTEYGLAEIPVVPLVPWGAAAAILLLGAWAMAFRALLRRAPVAAFLWAFAPAAFAVTGNFAIPIGTIFAERLAYLPLAGACGLAGLALAALPLPRSALAAIVAAILALAAFRTASRGQDFKSLLRFREATARASPRSVKALANLGRARLEVQKRPAEAIEPLERAVALLPDYAFALRLLSRAYEAEGFPERAEEFRRRADAAPRGRPSYD